MIEDNLASMAELAKAHEDLSRSAAQKAEDDKLLNDLKAGVAGGGAVEGSGGQITVTLVDKVLFKSGEAGLTPEGEKVIRNVGSILAGIDRNVEVSGHTDDVPIATDEFPSNWELSTARALNVVHFLEMDSKIPARRLAAVGFGQYRPISKKRAANRRIEIVLFPEKVQLKGN